MRDSLPRIAREIVSCRTCTRLVAHREHVAATRRRAYRDWEYWGRPVPGFGDPRARLVLVGLAPGAHGSNRTGRQFTGDASGDFLYPALHRAGFASQPDSVSRDDGMRLEDCFITSVVRCAPPANKPTREEFDACFPYLARELGRLRRAQVFVALGRHAFDGLVRALPGLGLAVAGDERPSFGHAAEIGLTKGRTLLSSYHPSRQNTQTGRLTRAMFDRVFRRARRLVGEV